MTKEGLAATREAPTVQEKPTPKYLGTYAGIMFFSNEGLKEDEAVLGYPDGKGGFKDGWVRIVNMGDSK